MSPWLALETPGQLSEAAGHPPGGTPVSLATVVPPTWQEPSPSRSLSQTSPKGSPVLASRFAWLVLGLYRQLSTSSFTPSPSESSQASPSPSLSKSTCERFFL